jgi:type I restriction enzyme S subunit
MSDLSINKKHARLGEITDLIQYGYTAKSAADTKGPKYLRITDIQNDNVDWTRVPHVTLDADDFERYRLVAGDIVFARTGATVGKSFLIRDDPGEAVFASYLIRVRCTPCQFDPRYAALFFQSEDYWRQIREGAAGTGQPNFNGTKLGGLVVPLRPLSEQRQIVSTLSSLFAHSKNAREELSRIPRLVERYKHAILGTAFRGQLTGDWRASHPDVVFSPSASTSQTLPHGRKRRDHAPPPTFDPPYKVPPSWLWTPLSKLGALDRGRSRHRPRNDAKLYGGPYPFVQTGDIKAALGRLTTFTQTYSEAGLAQSRLWPKGTLCITIAANIAETAILGIDACFPDSIVGFIPNEQICNPLFLEFFIRTVKADLAAFAPATAQKNINLETLRVLHIPCPPLIEQRQIVERIEAAFKHIDQTAREASRATQLLDHLDQATLAKAFRGELVKRDEMGETEMAVSQ